MLPVRGPVADQFTLLGGGGSRKVGHPGINPPDRIDGIRTIRGDVVANEEIFRNIFLHPFFKTALFFNRPAPIADFPDLVRGFTRRLAETRSRGKKDQGKNEKGHGPILKRMAEDCQQRRGILGQLRFRITDGLDFKVAFSGWPSKYSPFLE